MFNLSFIQFNDGLIRYWHNGFCHFLDSKNGLVKIPCTKERAKAFKCKVHRKPRTVVLCAAVGKAAFYERVFIDKIEMGIKSFKLILRDSKGELAGSVEVSNKRGKEPIECSHNLTKFLETTHFKI